MRYCISFVMSICLTTIISSGLLIRLSKSFHWLSDPFFEPTVAKIGCQVYKVFPRGHVAQVACRPIGTPPKWHVTQMERQLSDVAQVTGSACQGNVDVFSSGLQGYVLENKTKSQTPITMQQ